VIRRTVREALDEEGYRDAVLDEVLSPPWTSDWLTDEGRRKLESFGIAPPSPGSPTRVSSPRHLLHAPVVTCPRCGSRATERISEFGSTPCKAHYRCTSCLEPFDYFKCI
jgi:ring-1,2-phenylacetyl-CoA epoxidase subunit PaaD